jgi:hypothetical protein
MANNGKGIGPNGLGAGRGSVTSPAKQKMVASENMTVAEKKKMKDNSVFGPDGKNVALPPSEKNKLVKGSNKKDEKKPKPAPSPAKIRKALSTKVTKPKQPGDEGYVKPKETSKFMRKAGTRASGGGQDRKV